MSKEKTRKLERYRKLNMERKEYIKKSGFGQLIDNRKEDEFIALKNELKLMINNDEQIVDRLNPGEKLEITR